MVDPEEIDRPDISDEEEIRRCLALRDAIGASRRRQRAELALIASPAGAEVEGRLTPCREADGGLVGISLDLACAGNGGLGE